MATRPGHPTGGEPRIEVVPAVGRFDDFVAVVGTDRPDARGCWCMSYRDTRKTGHERPEHMRAECATDPGPGVLAYVDGVVAGWCSIVPRDSYRRLLHSRTIPIIDELDAWVAVCFVVRSGYRKHGLMHHLLAGAVRHAAAHGAEVVEGYPADMGGRRVDAISGYVGTVELFERAGFEWAAATSAHSGGQPRQVMRRALT